MNYNPYYQTPYQQMYNPPMQDQLAQYRQAYQFTQNQPQAQQQSGMVWVKNRFDADNYPVAPNTAVALWDMSGPYVYRKETDVSGRPVVKTFQLVEVSEAQKQQTPGGDFITRQEFQAFVDSLGYQPKFAAKEEPVNE